MITDPDDIDAIGGTLSWDGVKTWAEKYPLQWAKARREAIKREADGYETDRAEVQLEGRRWFDQVQELWEQQPPSEQEIEEAKRKMSDDFDFIDPRLERWTSRSTDAEAKAYYTKEFEALDRAGMLTEAAVNAPEVPDDVRRRYLQIAQQQDQARRDTPEFKQYGKQLEADITSFARKNSLEPGAPGTELAIAKAQADFNRYYMAAVQAGENPVSAAQNAYNRVAADIQRGQQGQGVYKFNQTGEGFTELLKGGFSTGWEKHKAAVNAKLKYGGVASLDKYALIPEGILQDAITNSNNPNYSLPAIAQYISDLTGGTVSPWAVLDRQAKAQGLGGLAPNPRIQAITQGMRPEFTRLLSYRPSYNRVARSYASTGAFNPDRIPQGYGQVVLEAATQHGIDPAILAGLIETESSWNPSARSSAGAIGIAQIVPKWHPTVDPTKPKEAIFYAAKHLAGLRAALGGNMDEAIYAYNGGTGGIRKSAENRAYHPKVMRAAAKYGYNPTGNPWSNPALLNPRVAYVTGNIGPTSTGQHLDVKQVGGGNFAANALDRFVEVDDPQLGRVALSKVPVTNTQAQHRARGSHGIDYGTYSGSKVYLKNGARVVGSVKTEHGDKVTIQLPNGQKYTFLHGRSA
jgi:soluble lytic murein transglycosylase-like protein